MSLSTGPSSGPLPPTSPTSARQRRAGHVRSNASLTSSMASASSSAFPSSQRRTSAAASIFDVTGLDPMRTEPDTLFVTLSVKEVEQYERNVRNAALEKQQELRHLVGQSYQDLLSTANTIIDMSDSSEQLSTRLRGLSQNIRETAAENTMANRTKKSRRLSFLPVASGSCEQQELQLDAQEEVYALGASLKLIMDAPEYVWASIEKGKTLQAAWTFMLARAAWWDLNDSTKNGVASSSKPQSHVKQTFPFIEKQWQSMIPMRKQIVQRATTLLADAEIEHMAVVDQLATLMLLDGAKTEQAFQMLLTQRQSAVRKVLHKQSAWSDSKVRNSTRRPSVSFDKQARISMSDPATSLSTCLEEVIKLLTKTVQHAAQIFVVHPASKASTRSLLHSALTDIIDSGTPSQVLDTPGRQMSASPSADPESPSTTRLSPAFMRAARRKSSYGMPRVSEEANEAPRTSEPVRKPRVSTSSVLQALPSAQVLARLLPESIWAFSPHIELEECSPSIQSRLTEEACNWIISLRDLLVLGHNDPTKGQSSDSVKSLLEGISDIASLTSVLSTCRTSLARARRGLVFKLNRASHATSDSTDSVAKLADQIDGIGAALDVVFQQRLESLVHQDLANAVQSFLSGTRKAVNDGLEPWSTSSLFSVHDSNASSVEGGNGLQPAEASRAHSQLLANQLLGRTSLLEELANLYETPVSALQVEADRYLNEVRGNDPESATATQSRLAASFLASRNTLVEQLQDLLQQQMPMKDSSMHEVSGSVRLLLQLISVLTAGENDSSINVTARGIIDTSLRQCWYPIVEQRIKVVLSSNASPSDVAGSISKQLLTSLTMLSDSILQLGSSLVSEELALVTVDLLTSFKAVRAQKSDLCADKDISVLESLIARNGAETNADLRCVSVVLVPLLTLLEKEETGKPILVASEPVSLSKSVPTILQLANVQAKRFQSLPIRL